MELPNQLQSPKVSKGKELNKEKAVGDLWFKSVIAEHITTLSGRLILDDLQTQLIDSKFQNPLEAFLKNNEDSPFDVLANTTHLLQKAQTLKTHNLNPTDFSSKNLVDYIPKDDIKSIQRMLEDKEKPETLRENINCILRNGADEKYLQDWDKLLHNEKVIESFETRITVDVFGPNEKENLYIKERENILALRELGNAMTFERLRVLNHALKGDKQKEKTAIAMFGERGYNIMKEQTKLLKELGPEDFTETGEVKPEKLLCKELIQDTLQTPLSDEKREVLQRAAKALRNNKNPDSPLALVASFHCYSMLKEGRSLNTIENVRNKKLANIPSLLKGWFDTISYKDLALKKVTPALGMWMWHSAKKHCETCHNHIYGGNHKIVEGYKQMHLDAIDQPM
jgi:hypothetical protein